MKIYSQNQNDNNLYAKALQIHTNIIKMKTLI